MKYLPLICCAFALLANQPETPAKAKQLPKTEPLTKYCCPILQKTNMGFYVYGEFFYMQPNITDWYYGASAIGINQSLAFPASIISPSWTILEIDPGYHPGFEVGIGVASQKADVRVGIDWQRLHGNDSDSFQAESLAGHMVGPFFDIGPNAASYKIARGNAASHFDEVDLTIAKDLCFFENFHTRFYGAASFLRIKETLKSSYSNVSQTIARNVTTTSRYMAGGPQVGLDYDYRIYKSFFFSGNSAISLYVGQMKNTTTFQSFTPELNLFGVAQPNNQEAAIPNRIQIVPAFEQKLGFSCIGVFNCMSVLFEFGYRCQIYLDAVQNFNIASEAVPVDLALTPDVGVFAVAFAQSNSNFMLAGPYVRLGFDF